MAQDLLCHTQALCLEGELARSGRRTTLHLPRRWPWAAALLRAFERLRALPAAA